MSNRTSNDVRCLTSGETGRQVLFQQIRASGGLHESTECYVYNLPADEIEDEMDDDMIEQLCLFRWR